MKKIFLALILLFTFPMVSNAADTTEKFYTEAYIQENGDLLVKELILLAGDYNNGYRKEIKYIYNDTLYGASSLEIVKVCEGPEIVTFDSFNQIGVCFQEEKGYSGASKIYEVTSATGKTTILSYNPLSLGRKSFYFEYILKDVVIIHKDVAELSLNIIDKTFIEDVNDFKYKVFLPNNSKDLRVWLHGPMHGMSSIVDQKTVLFDIQSLPATRQVDIRLTFDKNLVSKATKKTTETMLKKIVFEETLLAIKANLFRILILMPAIITYASIFIWIIGMIILWIKYYHKYDKEIRKDFHEKYLRSFPSYHTPEYIDYLFRKKIDAKTLSTVLLNVIRKKGLLIKPEEYKTKGIFETNISSYALIKNDDSLQETLTEEELMVRTWFIDDCGDGSKVNLEAIKNYGRSYDNANKFNAKYSKWQENITKKAEQLGFFEKISTFIKVKNILFALSIIPIIFMSKTLNLYTPYIYFLLIPMLIYTLYVYFSDKRSLYGNELYIKWKALKNFLQHFGSFKDKTLPEISLWEKYLVYANIFGLSKRLRKQMRIIIMNFGEELLLGEDSFFKDDFDNFNFDRKVKDSLSNGVNNSKKTISMHDSFSSGSFSSGRGSGGGSSGGGGRSGGGGSGGGRF